MIRGRIFFWILFLLTAPGVIFSDVARADGSPSARVSAVDPNSQYMAIGHGNVLQVYDLQGRQMVRTVSLPVSVPESAEIRTLAVNPVSFVIAVGVRRHDHPDRKLPLYLYGTDGRRYAEITDISGEVRSLAFSPDGSYLAVATVETRSLQIFKMKELNITYSYKIPSDLLPEEMEALKRFNGIEDVTMNPERVFTESGYPGDVTAMTFLPDGRLVTASADGTIRLYDVGFRRLRTVQIDKGGCPGAIHVTADGSRIAMTFSDNQRIDIISAGDLRYLYSSDTPRFSGGRLETVSWSEDGKVLYVMGREKDGGSVAVGRLSAQGRGGFKALSEKSAASALTALKGGGVALIDSDLHLSVLDRRYASFQNERLTLWTSVGAKFGDVTYQIGGHYIDVQGATEGEQRFPISELKWPINAVMGEVGAEWRIGQHWALRGAAFHNLTNSFSGEMEDSDWLGSSDTKDIYSESSIDFQAYGVDLGVRYWFMDRQYRNNETFSLGVGLGFAYNKYSWDGCNVNQWSPSGNYPSYTGTVGGIVIQYESWMSMPYLELVFRSKLDRLELSGGIGGTPYMMTSDRDNHLLRDRISWGEANGWAVRATADALYTFAGNWFAGVHLSFLYFTADGTLEENDAGVPVYVVDQNITSRQFDAMFKIGRRF